MCVSRAWGGCESVQGEEVCEGEAHGGAQSGAEAGDEQEKSAEPQAGPDGNNDGSQAIASANRDSADDTDLVVVFSEPSGGSTSPPNAAGADSSTVLIAAIAGSVLIVALCAAGGVVVFCVATQRSKRPIDVPNDVTADSRYSFDSESQKSYGQGLSRDAQMRNDFAQGQVVRTKGDSVKYVNELSPEAKAMKNPYERDVAAL